MSTFNYIWSLLEPKIEYANLINKCKELWDSFPIEKQRIIYASIRRKKIEKKFIDYNPLFAIRNNATEPLKPRTQTLTFKEYYARFGTTLEQDGWRMTNPTGQQVIYVKN
jgi:hypothetical protein